MLLLSKSETEIAERISAYLKTELKKADVTYEELAKWLRKAWPSGGNGGLRQGQAKTGGDLRPRSCWQP